MMNSQLLDGILALQMQLHRSLRDRTHASRGGRCMNYYQAHALMVLKEHPKMTMNAFAAKLGVSPPSATSFVERLVRLGYVRRSVDRRNRRLVHLTLTTRGSRTLAKEMKEHARMFREVLRGLSTTELNDLRRILERLLVSVSSNV